MSKKKKWVWKTPPWVPDHIQRYLDDPESARMWDATAAGGPGMVTTLLLTSTGRRTGEPRLSPLIYQEVEGGFAVIASKGGYPDHPAWYLNLEANPECHIHVGAKEYTATARTIEGPEREAIWKKMMAVYPAYDDYQARTDRRIPVVLLEVAQ